MLGLALHQASLPKTAGQRSKGRNISGLIFARCNLSALQDTFVGYRVDDHSLRLGVDLADVSRITRQDALINLNDGAITLKVHRPLTLLNQHVLNVLRCKSTGMVDNHGQVLSAYCQRARRSKAWYQGSM